VKAITLWQPWASLVAIEAKKIETRSWHTNYRGWLAIHAALHPPYIATMVCPQAYDRIWEVLSGENRFQLPLGKVVAVASLSDCVRTDHLTGPFTNTQTVPAGSDEYLFGNYEPGRYGWVLDRIIRLPEPIPAKGAQGIWNWEPPAGLLDSLGIAGEVQS
jgi:hypothetical protein